MGMNIMICAERVLVTLLSTPSSKFVVVKLQAIEISSNRSVGHLQLDSDVIGIDVTAETCNEDNGTIIVKFSKPVTSAKFKWSSSLDNVDVKTVQFRCIL